MLFHHISCLPEKAVARNILSVGQQLNLPGLHVDVDPFLLKHEIIDVTKFSKVEWKTHIVKILESENRKDLIQKARNYKKLDYISMSLEDYEIKDYFSSLDLEKARVRFKDRAQCLTTCRRQFPSQFIRTGFDCPSCNTGSLDVISHWVRCPSHSIFLKSRNLSIETDLTSFYLDVINYRKSKLV